MSLQYDCRYMCYIFSTQVVNIISIFSTKFIETECFLRLIVKQ